MQGKRYRVNGQITNPNLATFRNLYTIAEFDDEQLAHAFAENPPPIQAATYGRRYVIDRFDTRKPSVAYPRESEQQQS